MPATLSIIRASNADLATIEVMIQTSMAASYRQHGLHWDSAGFHQRAANLRHYWLHVAGETAGVLAYRREADALYLADLHLLPAWQGQGLGTQALAWLRQQAAGLRELRLRTFADSRALGFYLRAGFRVVRQDGALLGLSCPLPATP